MQEYRLLLQEKQDLGFVDVDHLVGKIAAAPFLYSACQPHLDSPVETGIHCVVDVVVLVAWTLVVAAVKPTDAERPVLDSCALRSEEAADSFDDASHVVVVNGEAAIQATVAAPIKG